MHKFAVGDKVEAPYGPGIIKDIDAHWNSCLVVYDAEHILLPTWHQMDALKLLHTTQTAKSACECGAYAVAWMHGHHSSWCPEAIFAGVYSEG